jgi:predicted AAA+ superfamily ATPase
VESKISKTNPNYLFIDEVQEILGYPKALRAILAEGNWDVWVTGSNADFLSSDIAGSLSGRSIEFKIFPLNYLEFIEFHNLQNNDNSVEKYLRYGGLPYLRKLDFNEEMTYEYLRNIYNTILYKDVISRYNIKKTRFMEDLVFFLADNTASIVSAKKISDYLKSQKTNISTNRVIEYLDYLNKSFFINKIKRFDIKGKTLFSYNEKYYFQDLGLRNSIIGFKKDDINKLLENIVLNHFLSYGFAANVGKIGNNEIDFIFTKNNDKIYVQVAYLLTSEKVVEREFNNLKLIKDNYPKYVVSMDSIKFDSDEGIIHLRLIDLLGMEF